ncbi:MAG TPA: DUF1194 domain-containing protein [Hansschlegelia sp.]
MSAITARFDGIGLRRLALAAAVFLASAAYADDGGPSVDLELLLAVDVSYSMDAEEQKVQRDGYIEAMTSKPVLDAIRQGMTGRIAIAYVEWAGADEQRVVVPWTLVDGPETAAAFAERLADAPFRRAYRTSISSALIFGATLFASSGVRGARQVIDVSGDGPNNQGPTVAAARDEVLERGVVINGLPLMLKRSAYGIVDLGDLDAYYRDCVIGGPGAFMVPVRGADQFPEAVRTKLVMEIAGLEPEEQGFPSDLGARPTPTASEPATDCLAGEQIWRDRFGN